MTRQEVLSKLCEITSEVGREVYHSQYAHDCFCGASKFADKGIFKFLFESQVLDYIRDAVNEKMERERVTKENNEQL